MCGGQQVSGLDVMAVAQSQAVIFRYVRSIDATDAVAVSAHFTEDGICTGEFGKISGREALISFYKAAWADSDAQRTHFVTNVIVEESNDDLVTASALFLMTTRSGDNVELGWGNYRYSFSRSNALILELSISVDDSVPLTSMPLAGV